MRVVLNSSSIIGGLARCVEQQCSKHQPVRLGGVQRVCARPVGLSVSHAPSRRAAVLLAARAQGVPRTVYAPPHEEPRVVHVRQVTLLLRGETTP